MKELFKVVAVVFAAWITFLLTAPDYSKMGDTSQDVPVQAGSLKENPLEFPPTVEPTQQEFNYQARMLTRAAMSCQDYASRTYIERYGKQYIESAYQEIAQKCVDHRTKPYVDQLNEWGNTYPEATMRRLAEEWDRVRDHEVRIGVK